MCQLLLVVRGDVQVVADRGVVSIVAGGKRQCDICTGSYSWSVSLYQLLLVVRGQSASCCWWFEMVCLLLVMVIGQCVSCC